MSAPTASRTLSGHEDIARRMKGICAELHDDAGANGPGKPWASTLTRCIEDRNEQDEAEKHDIKLPESREDAAKSLHGRNGVMRLY